MNNFKFDINEIVLIDGLRCKVLERELGESDVNQLENDYLCKPLDETKMILGQTELGAGWVFEQHIERLSK